MILALLVSPASAYDITVNSDYSAPSIVYELHGNSANGSGDVNDVPPHGVTRSTNHLDNNGNTVTVSAAVTGGDVFGTLWITDGAKVTGNTVTITGNGSVTGSVTGGRNGFGTATAATAISGNKVFINTAGSGTIVGYSVIGGSGSGAATVTDNHVTILETNTGNVGGSIRGGWGLTAPSVLTR